MFGGLEGLQRRAVCLAAKATKPDGRIVMLWSVSCNAQLVHEELEGRQRCAVRLAAK